MRDQDGTNTMKNLRDNWIQKDKILKILNIKSKERCSAEIHLLKDNIFDYIKRSFQYIEKQNDQIYKLYQHYTHRPHY